MHPSRLKASSDLPAKPSDHARIAIMYLAQPFRLEASRLEPEQLEGC